MRIDGQTISEYFENKGMNIVIGHPAWSSLAAWVPHTGIGEGGNLAFVWLDKLPSTGDLVRLRRKAVVTHARWAKSESEHITWLHEASKQMESMHTVPQKFPSVRRVRRIAAPSQ
jgi:hypothetical protein